MAKSFGIVVFPGSNCDHDCYHVVSHVFGANAEYIWHKDDFNSKNYDCIILPGGFSYGDYLRPGAISQFSPVMTEIKNFAEGGGLVIGICNGFQILCESGLLPGALIRNKGLKFICDNVTVRVENNITPYTTDYDKGSVLTIPIAHADGSYFADKDTLSKLEDGGQVAFRYCNASGEVDNTSNPNGSVNSIAGIVNEGGNVLGMMPHPERACEEELSLTDGRGLFTSLLKAAVEKV